MNAHFSDIVNIEQIIAFKIGIELDILKIVGVELVIPLFVGEVAALDPLLDLRVWSVSVDSAGVNNLQCLRACRRSCAQSMRGATRSRTPRMAASRRLPSRSAWKAAI
jgi:hypothetical protein